MKKVIILKEETIKGVRAKGKSHRSSADRFFLLSLVFLMTVSLFGEVVFADSWLDDRFRKRIVFEISNTGSVQTECPVRLDVDTEYLIQQGVMLEDGRDIRFTGSDGVSPLPFSLLSGINTTTTQLGVRMDSIPVGTSQVYMYFDYVCDTIESVSNGGFWYSSVETEHTPEEYPHESDIAVRLRIGGSGNPGKITERWSPTFNTLNVDGFLFDMSCGDTHFLTGFNEHWINITGGDEIYYAKWASSGMGYPSDYFADPWTDSATYDTSGLTGMQELNFIVTVNYFLSGMESRLTDTITVLLENDPSISVGAVQEDCPNPLPSKIYYVKTNGDDNLDGESWDTAWATLSHASTNTQEGYNDVVRIDEGSYTIASFPSPFSPSSCTNWVGGYGNGSWNDWTEGSGHDRPNITNDGGATLENGEVILKNLNIDSSERGPMMFYDSSGGAPYQLIDCAYKGMIYSGFASVVKFINTEGTFTNPTLRPIPTLVTPTHYEFVLQYPNNFNIFASRKVNITTDADINVLIISWETTGDKNKQCNVNATGDRTITFQFEDMLPETIYDLNVDGVKVSSAVSDASGVITFPVYSGSFGGEWSEFIVTKSTSVCADIDLDGYDGYYVSLCPMGLDCDDDNINVNPGETDTCNGVDDDCDSTVDNGGDALCDNGLWCDGAETCGGVTGCQAGISVDCSGNNLAEVATCGYSPDDISLSWDYFAGFTSVCDEALDACTTGTEDLTHECSVSECGAECDATNPCAVTECDTLDGCYGDIYFDYADVANSCLGDCTCEANLCTDYIEETDPDGDGISVSCGDNCPDDFNPDQMDTDGLDGGDVCDICPIDATDTCDPDSSSGGYIFADTGGNISSPNGEVSLSVPPGALSNDTSMSITETTPDSYNVAIGTARGKTGVQYTFTPVGAQFNVPVTITFVTECTLNPASRCLNSKMWVYDSLLDVWESLPTTVEDLGGGIYRYTAETMHFTDFALVHPADEDNDGVFDFWFGEVDKCLGTVPGGNIWFAVQGLNPNHYDSSNLDLLDTYGCSCVQILYCKPGENNGEYKFGCSRGTRNIWENQTSWAVDCQVDGIVAQEGIDKSLLENTDSSDVIDILDGDNDNDGVSDGDDDMVDDKDPLGDSDHGVPDWHPKSKHKQ